MVGRPRFRYLIWGGALAWIALLAAAVLLLPLRHGDPVVRAGAGAALAVVAGLTLVFLSVLLLAVRRLVLRPLELLARETKIVSMVNPGHTVELPRGHLLGGLPESINELGAALWRARRDVAEAEQASLYGLEHNKTRLEDILLSLGEGILVCDDRARILFYNPSAKRVFHDHAALGLGRSLYLLCAAAPIENSLEILRQRRVRLSAADAAEEDVSFVCTTLQGAILGCRMRLLPPVPSMSWSFLLTCEDISDEAEVRGHREDLLRVTVNRMRRPLANLNLAAESLELVSGLGEAERAALDRALVEEAGHLVRQFDVLAREVQEIESPRYVIRDVLTEDLIACIARRLAGRGVRLTMIGDPLWVKADIHALLFLVEYLVWKIHEHSGAKTVEVETLLGDRRVYFNFCWAGPVLPQTDIERLTSAVVDPPGVHTVAEVLERHGSEIWSKPHVVPGFASLCLPMPSSRRQWLPPRPQLPARPVYVDFAAVEDGDESESVQDLPLDRIVFVVFDTETTGLAPLDGDEIVSLAGVRIVNRGIVVGETFDRIVDPGRIIPASSIRFHGLTDEMVRGKPSIEEALRAFREFVGTAVLVGHNAAFDLRFIRMKEERSGVSFRGPVLDTLAISRHLHDHTPQHSLDAIARRHGVEIRDRHTALGDALITAQVFLKFLHLLEDQGVATLGRLVEISHR